VELTHSFTVPAPVDTAWEAFNDLERITPCFPGAALTSYDGETFTGGVKVKLGPISMQYNGTGRFIERDESAYRAVIEAKGKDKRGNGTAAATITAELVAAGDARTDVVVRTDLNVTGKPAQFGRGVMQDVSDKLLGQFATCLESRLANTGEADVAEPAAQAEPALETEPAADDQIVPPASIPPTTEAKHRAPTVAPPADQAAPVPPPSQVDLAATVLPILLRRYAPHLAVTVVVLWLLRRLLRH
jgi:carbon monoxide dehydrogenase subunit G